MLPISEGKVGNEHAAIFIGPRNKLASANAIALYFTICNFSSSGFFSDHRGPVGDAAKTLALDSWDAVVVVLLVRDFDRTFSSNVLRTNHGWGGRYLQVVLQVGGRVKCKRILGQYHADANVNAV